MKSSYLLMLLPFGVLACAGSQEIKGESRGAEQATTLSAVPAGVPNTNAPTDKKDGKDPKPVPVASTPSAPTKVPGKPAADCDDQITDPGGYPGYPFMTCTAGATGCKDKSYDTCTTVPILNCPAADKYCRAVVASNNTCMSGETKTCPANPPGIAVCDVGPPDSITGLSACGWSKCKHCGSAGEPCCNPPAAACAAGKTCSVASGAAYPTCS